MSAWIVGGNEFAAPFLPMEREKESAFVTGKKWFQNRVAQASCLRARFQNCFF
jgi:hypothetical protein